MAKHDALAQPYSAGKPPHASERLVRALEAHQAAEADDAGRCQHIAAASDSDALRLILELIVDDARHHEMLMQRMVDRLRSELDLNAPPTAVPVPGADEHSASEGVATMLRMPIRDQQEGARYLRHMARHDADLYHGYFPLLLETFAHDGEKHVHLLRYLLRRIESA